MNKNDVFKMYFLYNYDLLLYISVAPKTHSCNLIEYIFPTFLVFFLFYQGYWRSDFFVDHVVHFVHKTDKSLA